MKQDFLPVIVIDTREQLQYSFPGYQTIRAGLETGDYSIQGFESLFAIERKEKNDMINCIGFQRERFTRELLRADSMLRFWVIVESSIETIERGEYRSKVSPASVLGTIAAWENRYNVRFCFAGNRQTGERTAQRLLTHAWKEVVKPSSRTGAGVIS